MADSSRGSAIVLWIALTVLLGGSMTAASSTPASDATLAVARLERLLDRYPDPDAAAEMRALLSNNLENGSYDLKSREKLAKALTRDLRSVRQDYHLGVLYSPDQPLDDSAHHLDNPVVQERLRRTNFGFDEVRVLEGNIGYIKISGLNDTSVAGATAKTALRFVENADALIIDIRGNLGGEPSMVQLLQSAFFHERTLMSTHHFTDGRRESELEFWTDPALVDGRRLREVPAYVLINALTASAAESLAYGLQSHGRATLVGEPSLGAAHPGDSEYMPELQMNFSMPHGYVVNPITGTDWEGTGVIPDVAADVDEAVRIATEHAWKRIGYVSAGAKAAAFGEPHSKAPVETRQLAFLVGQWELDTWFTQRDGSRKQSKATLTARYVLGGMGVETTEHYPSDGDGPDFIGRATYVFNSRLGVWTGVGINTLGNGKSYEVRSEDGRVVMIQSGMLFGGRSGINRITYLDVTDASFKSIHEHSPDDGKTWQESSFGYTARRIR